MGACFMNGSSYVAESFLGEPASAGATSPLDLSLLVTGSFSSRRLPQIREQVRLPGSPFQSVHFVAPATCCAARMASHSVGATTPTRLPFTTTCAFGKRLLSSVTGGNQRGAERLRMHHARVQHAGQPDIGGPSFFRRDFGR